jgi:hypothetical protein
MSWGRPLLAIVGLGLLPVLAGGCGSSASAGGGNPVAVAQGYLDAVKGNPDGGAAFLETESTEKLTGSTSLSRFLGKNKGATAKVVPVQWIPVGGGSPVSSKQECLVGQPAPSQICIVTVEVDGGKPAAAYFHLVIENRYTGKWQIINVDQVDKAPDNLLPSGNQAHTA